MCIWVCPSVFLNRRWIYTSLSLSEQLFAFHVFIYLRRVLVPSRFHLLATKRERAVLPARKLPTVHVAASPFERYVTRIASDGAVFIGHLNIFWIFNEAIVESGYLGTTAMSPEMIFSMISTRRRIVQRRHGYTSDSEILLNFVSFILLSPAKKHNFHEKFLLILLFDRLFLRPNFPFRSCTGWITGKLWNISEYMNIHFWTWSFWICLKLLTFYLV